MRPHLTRAEKLSRLKQFLKGKAHPATFAPLPVLYWHKDEEMYSTQKPGEKIALTEQEFKDYCKAQGHNSHHVIFIDFSQPQTPKP